MGKSALTRRDALKAMGLGAASLALAGRSGAQERRPNILFLFADDQRFDTIGALRNPAIETPNMDRLVGTGTAFTHCFIMGSTIGAVCVCSRASLITGRHLYTAPRTPKESDGLALWPKVFRDAGYKTFGTGKWHNGPWSYAQSFAHGASIFFGGMSDHLKVPVHDFDPTGQYPKEKQYVGSKFSSELFSDAAVDFLKQHSGESPFFMYVSYTAPHDPRMAPKEYADRYPPDKIELPPNFMPEHPFDNGEMRIRDEKLAPWPRTPEIIREHIAAYYAMITHLDAQIGRVLQALDESGQASNTIIIFGGDNGLAVGQHGLLGKQNLYDPSVRVPLIFSGPGIPVGERLDSLVYLHDIFPTTCELVGLPIPETVESKSLVPLLSGEEEKPYDSILAAYSDVQRMVRDERWKLIRYPYVDRTQLFDMAVDPWEMHDLSGDPQHAARMEALMGELKAWQERVGDKLDVDDPPPRPGSGIPVKPEADGSLVLKPEAARTRGSLRYQPDRSNLGAWVNPQDFPEWQLVDVRAGEYEVEFAYGSTNPGVEYTITVGDERLTGKTEHTAGIRAYKAFAVGRLRLPAGKATLAIKPGAFRGAIMNFRLLTLRPVQE
jgi:arylsulfatase A-like enzyme